MNKIILSSRNAISANVDRSLENQRERFMALNSKGLEGLVPRAKLLLSLGGTFFLGFGPLILITIAFFLALYLVRFFHFNLCMALLCSCCMLVNAYIILARMIILSAIELLVMTCCS